MVGEWFKFFDVDLIMGAKGSEDVSKVEQIEGQIIQD